MAQQAKPGHLVGGRYRLISYVGSGGFGRVWRARDESLLVDVAVKEMWLPPTASEAEHAERLVRAEREARNAAKLRQHPNIVSVHDVVVEDGSPWIVMEFVEGRSLAEHVAEHGPMPVDRVAVIAGALLTALGAAHAADIAHRDVKPANVMLGEDGRVLLTDFGIAAHDADTRVTATGALVGSLEYMAPERFDGIGSGPAGDLYSLGVTLYQAVEGFSPFHRDTPTKTLTAVVLGQAPAPQRAGALGPLISRLLVKDPGERPAVPQALAMLNGVPQQTEALPHPGRGSTAVMPHPEPHHGGPNPPAPHQPQIPAVRPPSRNIRLIAAAAGAVVVAVAVVAVLVNLPGKDGGGTTGSHTPASPSPETAASNGITIQAGCENLSQVAKDMDKVVTSDRYGNGPAPIADLLAKVQGQLSADVARATIPSIKTALQKEYDDVTDALNTYKSGDTGGFNKAMTAASLDNPLRVCIKAAIQSPG
ncbi:serine/threonine-protein kinase [Nonomuraea sediminis]|uniref:serine/threonine-protein kinase n=1 Tax=Nonomuraea sediminis TaxID=2835864 RepID=UPI001BDD0D8E|nr:serine/threonine-protein kinase [Nonomuraea sediminis]